MIRVVFLALILCLMASSVDAANRFGVCTTTCTWDGASTAMWSTTSGGGTGASVPGSSDSVVFDANTCVGGTTCTITVNTNPTIQTLTFNACTASTTGCVLDFSVHNNNLTLSNQYLANGSGTRTIKCGTGTFTFTSTGGSLWQASGATNYTETCSGVNITYQPASVASPISWNPIAGNYAAFSIVWPSGPQLGGFNFSLSSGTTTIASLSVTNSPVMTFSQNTTLAITAAPALTGTLANPILLQGNFPGNFSQVTITTPNTFTCAYCIFESMKATNATTIANAWDMGNNTNFTITAPAAGSGGGIIGQ